MQILIVSATAYELAPFETFLDKECEKINFFEYKYKEHTIYPLITGVGQMNMAFALSRFTNIKEIDLAINMGIAGGFEGGPALGEVVEITTDRFADLGVEEMDGSFTDIYELQLHDKDSFPYMDGWIINERKKYPNELKKVKGLTVNKVHGCSPSILKIMAKYPAQVETMEGAAFLYACKAMDVKCMQIKAISNRVEPRNRKNWQIESAIDNLNKFIISYINSL